MKSLLSNNDSKIKVFFQLHYTYKISRLYVALHFVCIQYFLNIRLKVKLSKKQNKTKIIQHNLSCLFENNLNEIDFITCIHLDIFFYKFIHLQS